MKIIGFIEDDEIIEKILRHLGLWETRSHGNRIPAQNPHKLVEEDLRFHQMLCELSGNKKLLQVWQTIEGQLRIFIVLEEARYDAYDQFVKGHQEVISAIRKKIPDLR